MNTWRVLADIVMYFHIILPLLFIGVLIFNIFRGIGFKWQIVFYVLMGGWIIMEAAPRLGWTKNCPLTDLEYFFRRHYDPSESFIRTRSLTATIVYNITGATVPEWVFTAVFGVIMAAAIGLIIARKIRQKKLAAQSK